MKFAPELQAKLNRLAAEIGLAGDAFVVEAVAEYCKKLDAIRTNLDSRYDDLTSGKVQPILGNEVFDRLREKSRLRRAALEPQGL